MANVKQMVNDVLGTINGALAILDKIPKLEESDGNFEFGMNVSPFALILEVLKNTKGYDYILDIISGFLIFALPELEVALKSLLMLNLKGLITCSLNPIIPNDLLKNGIVFDLKEIDIFNMLSYCPLDSGNGDNYYFGVKSAQIPDDLRRSQDFNAFLWYMVNRSNCREIWNRCTKGLTTILNERIIGETTNKEFTDDLGDYTENMLNSTLNSQNLPLKDFSCVDIDLATVDENGNNQHLKENEGTDWINAKWNDVFTLAKVPSMIKTSADYIDEKNYKNIKNMFYVNDDKNGFIYLTDDEFKKPIVYIAEEDEENEKWIYSEFTLAEDLFDNSENLYKFKVKKGYYKNDVDNDATIRNCIYKESSKKLKVLVNSIDTREYNYIYNGVQQSGSVRCGIFNRSRWENEYDLTDLDNCRVTGINEMEYYYCDYMGYVVKRTSQVIGDKVDLGKGETVKFRKLNAPFEIKTNLLTGENQNVKIGIKTINKKLKKSAGIITLEYHEDRSSLQNAEGGQVSGLSLPLRNCLHVFIGNVQPQNYGDIIKLRNEIRRCENDKKILQDEIDTLYEKIEKAEESYNDIVKTKKKQIKKNGVKGDDIDTELDAATQKAKEDFQRTQSQCLVQIANKTGKIRNKENEISSYESSIYASEKTYRRIEQNYYYKHTLIEFNFDYIWSLKLFDPKVVTAQLIDAIVGLFTINLGLSYEQIFLQEEIKGMVKQIIETDDTEVNDCFFTFSNDKYNSLVIQSEKKRQGLYSTHPNQEGIKIDMDSIQNALNSIDSSSSKEEQRSAIKGALQDISGTISKQDYQESDNLGVSIGGMDFIENLLTNLATVIAQAFLSPKVYLLLAVNMKIMGEQTDVTIEMLIAKLKNLIVDMIRLIRDQILNYFIEKLMEILREISINVGVKLALEQAIYYYNLIMKLINCFKTNGQSLGFTVDEVNHADIYEQEPTPPAEC